MRVISLKRLREFWTKYHDAEVPLRTWYKIVERADWSSIADVRKTFPQADGVLLYCGILVTIFNIRGNNYRLATRIEYNYGHVYVKRVMTHREYSANKWPEKICNE